MDVIQLNPFELAVKATKDLEALLLEGWDADGIGLIQKLNSVGDRIPQSLVNKIRRLGSIRNKLVHDNDINSMDVDSYQLDYIQVKSALEFLIKKDRQRSECLVPIASPPMDWGNDEDDGDFLYSNVEFVTADQVIDTPIVRTFMEEEEMPIVGFPWWVFGGYMAVGGFAKGLPGAIMLALAMLLLYAPIRYIKSLVSPGDLPAYVWMLIFGFAIPWLF